MSTPTLLPDTNIWRYVVDADDVERVRLAARQRKIGVVACPAVAFEMLRTSDVELRRTLVEAITRGSWVRPMPEVFQCAEELRAEITRVRSDWLHPEPDLAYWYTLRADWQSGWWRRARKTPHLEARFIDQLGGQRLKQARHQSVQQRRGFLASGIHFDGLDLQSQRATFTAPVSGWNGEPFESWRADGLSTWWDGLFNAGPSSPYRDWLGPWLNLDALRKDSSGFVRFWTTQVSSSRLPLQWLRWAIGWAQLTRKVTPGTP